MNISMNSYTPMNSSTSSPPPPSNSSGGAPVTEDLLAFLDSDGSGDLSMDEIAADSGLSSIITDDVFATADADGDGVLSAAELETTKPDGPPPPPPSEGMASSTTSGTDAASLFESLLETSEDDSTFDFAASIEGAMSNAQNMYDMMQDLFSSVAA